MSPCVSFRWQKGPALRADTCVRTLVVEAELESMNIKNFCVTLCHTHSQLVHCTSTRPHSDRYSIGAQLYMYAEQFRVFLECFGEVSGLQTQFSTKIDDPLFLVTILLYIPETTQVSQFTCAYWIPFRIHPEHSGGGRA